MQNRHSGRRTPPQTPNAQPGRRKKRRPFRRAIGALLLVIALLAGWMLFEAQSVRLIRDDVSLADLPEALDGATILFVSDIHLDFYNAPERASALLHKLAQSSPDMIVLGGDYSTYGLDLILMGKLNRGSYQGRRRIEANRRDRFFELLADIDAPLGKFAVAGNHDNMLDGLKKAVERGGFTLLRNQAARVERNGDALYLAGLDDWTTGNTEGYRDVAKAIDEGDCAIVISHNPDSLPRVSALPGREGGAWADLMLSGHTHGGQIRPFGKQLFSSTVYGDRYLTGWISENGTHLLTSNGAGSLFLPLRLGAAAQAHLITLRRAS